MFVVASLWDFQAAAGFVDQSGKDHQSDANVIPTEKQKQIIHRT